MELIRSAEDAAAILQAHADARVWGYCRVSSAKQDLEGAGLEVQRQAIVDYCAAHGLASPIFFVEVKSAAKPMLTVPMGQFGGSDAPVPEDEVGESTRHLMLLLQRLGRKGDADLIVYRLDRLSRLAYEQELLMETLKRRKVRLHSTIQGEGDAVASADPSRILLRQIMASFAQYERAMIQARLDAGLRLKAARGGWVAGRPPRGYRAKDRDLVVTDDPNEIADIQRLFLLKTTGMSLRAIARDMDKHGRADAWKPWSHIAVRRISAMSSVYLGVIKDRYGGVHSRPDLRFPGIHTSEV